MQALGLVVLTALLIAGIAAWGLASTQGLPLGEAFLNAFYMALIGAAVVATMVRRDLTAIGIGQMLFYLLLWLGAIAAVMLAYPLFNR